MIRECSMYELRLRYVYTFYSFDQMLDMDVREESVEIGKECRFKLYQEEDASFILSPLMEDISGKFVILTHPNKDRVVVREAETAELVYDEYFNSMGDDNHNVYEGALTLEKRSVTEENML